MKKKEEQKELYLAPQVEVWRCALPNNVLNSFSGQGELDEYEDGGLLEIDED